MIKPDNQLLEKYSSAKEIYMLQRSKKMSLLENIIDWLVCLLTPLPGIVDEADYISDMGVYYLVVMEESDILVRQQKNELTEQKLSAHFTGRRMIWDGNVYRKVSKIYG